MRQLDPKVNVRKVAVSEFMGHFLVILLGAVGLCLLAWYNRFPLTYSDTGTYITHGFLSQVPVDRPIYYCLFIRHVSMAASLFFVVMAQGWMVSYLLYRFLGIFFRKYDLWVVFLSIVGFLVLTTGLSWNVSILIPDIFTSIGFLAIFNMLLHPRLRKVEWVVLPTLLILSISVHLSNIPILGGLFALLAAGFAIQKLRHRESDLKLARLAVVGGSMVAIVVAMPFMNKALGGERRLSEGSHVFQMGHMLDIGVLQKHLAKRCPEAGYKLCEYKDEINWTFMWGENSPLYKTGGWRPNRDEFNRILSDIHRDPELLLLVVRHNIEFSVKQFFLFEVDELMPFDTGHSPFEAVLKHFPDSKQEASSSGQKQKTINVKRFNERTRWVTFVALLIVLIARIHPGVYSRLPREMRWMVSLTMLLLVINAFVCGNLSTPLVRYQNRIAWLAVMDAILVVMLLLRGTPLWDRILASLRPAAQAGH